MTDTKEKVESFMYNEKRGRLTIKGRLVSVVLGGLIAYYVTGPIVVKMLKKVG